MAQPQNFVDLNAGFYNALSQGLGYSPEDPFQVIQPSPPLSGELDKDGLLWDYLNAIPPYSLTQNTILSGGNQFLADYQTVMSALQAAPNRFAETVGPVCFGAYQNALKVGAVLPGPVNFRNWAMVNGSCSAVAVSGASALAAAMLDPIFAAQMNVLPYQPAGTEPVNFKPGYDTMLKQLNNAPSRSFTVTAGNWNTNVSSSWCKGSTQGLFGLWGNSNSSSSISQKFAASAVGVQASFSNVLPFNATPGVWYSSAALGLAFNNPNQAPWVPNNPINWGTTFGPNGNMQRFCASLLIANKLDITVTSAAVWTEDEQSQIQSNSSKGLWPFYVSSSSSGSSSSAHFNANGNMQIRITSNKDIPVVIGCTVVPAAQYLGHEAAASTLLKSMFYA